MNAVRTIAASVLAILVVVSMEAWAVDPSLSTMVPRGGARGTDVDVVIRGKNLADTVDLMFHGEGVTLKEITKAEAGRVRCVLTIAPDCALGPQPIRVRTATGLSNLRLFSVGNLTEIDEAEPNSQMAEAKPIGINSTVNGVVDNEDVDYFTVDLAEGDRIAAEIEALRLGHQLFDAKIRFYDTLGREVIAEDDTALMKQDAAFVYTAKEAGTHTVAVSEAAYGGQGNYNYRLHVGNFPRPLAVTPMGGVPGSTVQVKWLGDSGIQTQEVTLPAEPAGLSPIVAATDTGFSPTPVPFRLLDHPGVSEVEPNNAKEQATAGKAPGAFDGVIGEKGDMDWYSFEAKKGEKCNVRVWGREMGSPLDSVLVIHNPSGSQLASDDDSRGMDSFARITIAEDGVHTLRVHDLLKRGGETFAYRVEITPITPKLTFYLPDHEPASLVLPQGNRMLFKLSTRRADFDGPVKFSFLDLPEGVTAEFGEYPPGVTELPVLITATPEAVAAGALASIAGICEKEGLKVEGGFEQSIPLVYGRNKTVHHEQTVYRMALAVTDKAPYSIDFVAPKSPIIQRSTKPVKVVAARDEGFTAPIKVRVPFFPSGFGGGTATIPEGQTEAYIQLEARPDAPVGEMKLAAIGESGGYQVATQLTPVPVDEPWLRFEMEELRLEQGLNAEAKVKLVQVKPFEGQYELEMRRLPKGVTTSNQLIDKSTTEVTFPLTVAPDAAEGKHGAVGFAITIRQYDEDVLHQYPGQKVTVFKPLPPQLQKKPKPKPKDAPKVAKEETPKRRTRFPETLDQ